MTTQERWVGVALPLSSFSDRVSAMPGRFDEVLHGAAVLMEPEVHFVTLPRRTLKTEEEIEAWGEEVKAQLKSALEQGPVVIC